MVLSVDQISQSMVQVNMSVDNTQCVATYVVNTTQDGDSGSSTASPVVVNGLDVCRYNYSFVGYVITPDGESGELSPPFNFTSDLSGTVYKYMYRLSSNYSATLKKPQVHKIIFISLQLSAK